MRLGRNRRWVSGVWVEMKNLAIEEALERLQDAARAADHSVKENVTVRTDDLVTALQELDRLGVIYLDMD